jgi:hypothetical protein
VPTLALKRPARAVIAPLPRADGSPARGSLADACLAAAPRIPLWTLATEPYPLPTAPRAAPAARACPSPAVVRRRVRPRARGWRWPTAPGIGAGAWSAGHFMAAPRAAQDFCVCRPRIWLFNGFPLHGRLKTIRDRKAIPAYGTRISKKNIKIP